jgi:hypothetical protein
MPRKLVVSVREAGGSHAPVLLPTLVRTLDAVQRATLQIGEMLARPTARRSRGEFASALRESCEFVVCRLHGSSAEVDLELRRAAQGALIPPDEPPVGERALETMLHLTREVTNGGSWEAVASILPEEHWRRLVLGTYKGLCPTAVEQAEVHVFSPDSGLAPSTLRATTRNRIRRLAAVTSPADADTLEERQLIGRLVMMRSRQPGPEFALRQERREFACPYDEDLEHQLLDLYDEVVVVRGLCRVLKHDDQEDEVLELRDIGEVVPFDTNPLVVHELTVADTTLKLPAPIRVEPRPVDNLVGLDYPPLGIVASGETRNEAEVAFLGELGWLWQTYAQADESTLAPDAIELRAGLLAIVGKEAS